MVNRSKHNLSNGLIGTSIIFLAGFLIYWNINNYKQELTDLKQDLSHQMRIANSEIQDSLFWRVVNVFSDSSQAKVKISSSSQAKVKISSTMIMKTMTNDTSWVVTRESSDIEPMGLDSFVFSNVESVDSDINRIHPQIKIDQHKEDDFSDMIVMIQDFVGDSEHSDSINEHEISWRFEQKLEREGLPHEFEVTVINGKSKSSNIGVPLLDSKHNPTDTEAVFSGYDMFLIKKIIPSIVASTVLLGIVMLTFYVLRKSWQEQEKLALMKDDFVSNMTHELKTPIATMSVAMEALSEYGGLEDPTKTKEYIDISKKELHRLESLVERVLHLSASDHNSMILCPEKVDVTETITTIASTLEPRIMESGKNISFHKTLLPIHVNADETHLKNVIYNLLDNALKHGGDEININVVDNSSKNTIEISISDNGSGIDPQFHGKVFDRFFRVPSDNLHEVKGHGLGLHYVKNIVEQMDGKVSIKSNENNSPTFSINLPKHS